MSDVLIKGKDKPTSCRACMYSRTDIRNVDWCVLTEKDLPCDCPIIEVPKHGRLIDADALLNLLNKCMFPSDMVTTRAVRMATNWIKEAPTILEAEEGER